MSGLLIKDFNLMKSQYRFFVFVVGIAILMGFSTTEVFLYSYISVVIPLFTLNTISYDEFDNGNAFLFTLPISRKAYVYEKYCFGLLLGVASSLLSALLLAAFSLIKKTSMWELLTVLPFLFWVIVFMLAVMIPIQLKFGADKGRIALFMVFGIAGVLGYGIVQLLKFYDIDVAAILEKFSELGFGVLVAIAAAIMIVILLFSVRISVSVMNKKEF